MVEIDPACEDVVVTALEDADFVLEGSFKRKKKAGPWHGRFGRVSR